MARRNFRQENVDNIPRLSFFFLAPLYSEGNVLTAQLKILWSALLGIYAKLGYFHLETCA